MTTHIVALSGGKDSTAMALRLQEVEPQEYLFVCTPTGDELPEMFAHWNRLSELLGTKILPVMAGITLNTRPTAPPTTTDPPQTDASARRYLRRLDTIVPGALLALYEHHRGRGVGGVEALEWVREAHRVAVAAGKGGE